MAEKAELLEWPKKDKRRFLHVVYRVGDLDRTIQYLSFSLFHSYKLFVVISFYGMNRS